MARIAPRRTVGGVQERIYVYLTRQRATLLSLGLLFGAAFWPVPLCAQAQLLREEKVLEHTKDGIARTSVIIYRPPIFYHGPTPLKYESGIMQMSPGSRFVVWNKFTDFRVDYSFENTHGIHMLMASAVARDNKGSTIAKAEVIEIVKGSGVQVREEHLDSRGAITYSAKSFFGFDGDKRSETDTKGQKQREYFFLWPF